MDIARATAISLLMCNSEPYDKIDAVVSGLVDLVRPFAPEAVLGVPEQGIPLVHGVGRALGLRRSYLLRKTPKAFDVDPLKIEYTSVTKTDTQSLYLSREDATELQGKRVAIIEDVVNTGGSLKAGSRPAGSSPSPSGNRHRGGGDLCGADRRPRLARNPGAKRRPDPRVGTHPRLPPGGLRTHLGHGSAVIERPSLLPPFLTRQVTSNGQVRKG